MKRNIFIKKFVFGNVVYAALLNNEYEGNIGELKNVIQETCMNALYSNKNKDYIEINSLCLPSRVRFNNHIDNSILVGRNQLYSLNDLKNKYENEFPFKEYSNKLLELLENYSKEEISIQSFLEQALSETQTYSNDSLFRENKEKSIDIAYFTNVIKKWQNLLMINIVVILQSSEYLRYHYLFKIIIHIMLLLNLISIFIKKDFNL